MKLLGIRILLLTNASGGLRHGLHSGDILMIRDHVSLSDMTGRSALWGPNDERWGPRFPAIHNIYDKELRGLIRQASEKLGLGSRLSEGIYCYSPGPSYNTAVEVRFMRDCLRTDVVGMSTAYEAVTAVHCGLRVACLSLVTEVCLADENDEESVSHEAVLAASQASADHMKSLVSLFIQSTNESA